MDCDMEPTAPQIPLCESCSAPAQLQCGHCKDLFFCDKLACFEALHPRVRDRDMHIVSVTSYGTSSNCALHPEFKLYLVCEDPACGDAMICVRCEKRKHAGHNTIEISEYVARQHCILRSHAADLTKQRAAADEECRVLEAAEPPEARYKDLLLQTHVGHLLMGEDVWRSNVVCEEALARSFLTQALSAAGQVCALKTFVAKAEHIIEQVCLLEDDEMLRAVTELQAVARSINSMAACRDRHRLVGAAYPHAEFSLTLPVSDVHDALGKRLELVVPVLVEGVDGVEHLIEVSVDDTVCDLRRKVASAKKLPGHTFEMCFRDEVMGEGEDMTQLSADRIVLKQTKEQVAVAALDALGETNLTAARLAEVTDAKVACLLLQAGVATAIPNKFFFKAAFVSLDLSAVSGIASIGHAFLKDCASLEVLDISGLTSVTSIGTHFLRGCKALKEVDLTPLSKVTVIPNGFLYECTSLTQLDLCPFSGVTSVGRHFLVRCTSLMEIDLSPLSGITAIGPGFLSLCTSLKQLDLSPFVRVTAIDSFFLCGCKALEDLNLAGSVTVIKDCFLNECHSLTELDLSPLSNVLEVGTHFLFKSSSAFYGKKKCSKVVLQKLDMKWE